MNFDIKDPFEFQVVPEEIIRKLSRGESLDGICNEMFNYLARSIPGFFNMRPFVFVGPVRGYQVFMVQAYFAVLWREATNEQKAHYIRELTTRFLPINSTEGTMLPMTKAKRILATINPLFLKSISDSLYRPLRFFYSPYRYDTYSRYHQSTNSVLVQRVPAEASPVEVFLHELGHSYHCSITRDINTLPGSFALIEEFLRNDEFEKPVLSTLVELFAHFFVCAAAVDTPLEKECPIIERLGSAKAHLIKAYFDLTAQDRLAAHTPEFWNQERMRFISKFFAAV